MIEVPHWAEEAGLVGLAVACFATLGAWLHWALKEAQRLYGPGGFDPLNMAHRRIQREYREGKWRESSPYVPGVGISTPETEAQRKALERTEWMGRQRFYLWEWEQRFERWQRDHRGRR